MKSPRAQAMQFKIELEGVEPSIWRRIQVRASYSFWDLHVAIQDAMGWEDCHLHVFLIAAPEAGDRLRIGIPMEDEPMGHETLPGWDYGIADFFVSPNATAYYEYDFGDSWGHTVTFEEIVPAEKGKKYPVCVDGDRRCPPEDCGGTFGFEEFLAAIGDPKHEEHRDMLEWAGGSYDPEEFDAGAVRFDNPKKRWQRAFGR